MMTCPKEFKGRPEGDNSAQTWRVTLDYLPAIIMSFKSHLLA